MGNDMFFVSKRYELKFVHVFHNMYHLHGIHSTIGQAYQLPDGAGVGSQGHTAK